jgi:putative ABC transport system permease protein
MLWDISLKNLRRRLLRSIMTVLCVAVALQLYLTLNNLTGKFKQDIQNQFSVFAGKIFIQQAMPNSSIGWNTFPSLSSSIQVETASELLQLDRVDSTSSTAVLFVQLVAPIIPMNPPEVLAVGIESGHESAFLGNLGVESGQLILTKPHSVILGQGAVQYYQPEDSSESLGVGQTIEIQGQPFTIVGILESAPALFNGAVLMPLATAQDLLNRQGTVSAVILTATSIEDVSALKVAVQTQFPALQPSSQDELIESSQKMLDLMGVFFNMMNKTVLVMVAIVISIVMVVAVLEQRRDIGILRAIGARRWMILSLVVGESLTLSLIGAITALPLSVFASLVLWHWTVSIPIVSVWARILGISVALGVIASLLPAWQAVRVDPLEALRYE